MHEHIEHLLNDDNEYFDCGTNSALYTMASDENSLVMYTLDENKLKFWKHTGLIDDYLLIDELHGLPVFYTIVPKLQKIRYNTEEFALRDKISKIVNDIYAYHNNFWQAVLEHEFLSNYKYFRQLAEFVINSTDELLPDFCTHNFMLWQGEIFPNDCFMSDYVYYQWVQRDY